MSPEKTLQVVVQIVVLLFAVSFHESAHGWVALKCGDTTARDLGRITLNPLKHIDPIGSLLFPLMLAFAGLPIFGWARPVPVSLRGVPNPRRSNLLISAAGPLSNLLLAILFAGAVVLLGPLVPSRSAGLYPLLLVALASVIVNVSLAVFNLIPIPPLDGFGVVEGLAPLRLLPGLIWLRRYGFLLLFLLIFTGALGAIMNPVRNFLLGWLLS